MTIMMKAINGDVCKPQNFHSAVAPIIKEIFESQAKFKLERFLRDGLSLYIVAMVDNKETANLVERHYINKHLSHKMCLNSL